ncbi:MAG: translation initiation factor Sui1 [Nitrospiria bacterium]
MKNRRGGGDLVYSTEYGKMCPECGKAVASCICRTVHTVPDGDGIVRIALEKKGRKGKGVTVIRGLPLPRPELSVLSKKLKLSCGAGGSVKNGTIEIQGDHCEQLAEILKKEGWAVQRSGG